MGVEVDEAGRHDQPARVDLARGLRVREPPDRGNPIAANPDIGLKPRVAAAIDDAAAADQQIIWRLLRACREDGEGDAREYRKGPCSDAHLRSIVPRYYRRRARRMNLSSVASGLSRKDAEGIHRLATAAAFRLTASAKATASLAEALRAKAEAGSHGPRAFRV